MIYHFKAYCLIQTECKAFHITHYKLVLKTHRKPFEDGLLKYILFDGLAYNTRGFFASCVVKMSNKQNVRSYYM